MKEKDYKSFKSLLEIRDFCVRIINEQKDWEGPSNAFCRDRVLKFIKSKGYTKINSVKSLAYLYHRVIFTMNGKDEYVALAVLGLVKKKPMIVMVNFKKIVVEDHTYYIGSVKGKGTVFIIAPHFFHRYKERLNFPSLDAAIQDFMGYLLATLFDEYKVPGSSSGETLITLTNGVGLTHKTSLGIQGKDVIFFKTFITHDMLTEEQKNLIKQGDSDGLRQTSDTTGTGQTTRTGEGEMAPN